MYTLQSRTQEVWRNYGNLLIFLFLICLISLSLLAIVSRAFAETLRISFLDVGQGDAIYIRTPSGKEMLIDGGPDRNVLAGLSDQMTFFDRDIDIIVATHNDADHVTGLIPVLEKYDTALIIQSPKKNETGIFDELQLRILSEGAHVIVAVQGSSVDFSDGVKAYVLYPPKNISNNTDTNDASVSMLVTYGEQSFLFAGDLSAKHESRIMTTQLPRKITVFKAGHHGSKTSSGETLLSYIKPEYAIISTGKENKYGHPHVETLARLSTYAQETLSTIDSGTITFKSDGKMLEMITER